MPVISNTNAVYSANTSIPHWNGFRFSINQISMLSNHLLHPMLWFPKFSRITNDFLFSFIQLPLNMSIWNRRLVNWFESFEQFPIIFVREKVANAWADSKIFHSSKSIVVPMNFTFVLIHAFDFVFPYEYLSIPIDTLRVFVESIFLWIPIKFRLELIDFLSFNFRHW